jgi:hypothetical protein
MKSLFPSFFISVMALSCGQVFGGLGDATLRPGDILDMKLGGVPLELAQEFNTAYTVG